MERPVRVKEKRLAGEDWECVREQGWWVKSSERESKVFGGRKQAGAKLERLTIEGRKHGKKETEEDLWGGVRIF